MTKTVHGIIRGKTIEVAEDAGLPDGQSVEVIMRPLKANAGMGEGLRRSFGGWADDADDLDDI